jgi:hypothetical protein
MSSPGPSVLFFFVLCGATDLLKKKKKKEKNKIKGWLHKKKRRGTNTPRQVKTCSVDSYC